jgi:hypothetical protein
MSSSPLARELSLRTLDEIVSRCELRERGAPYLPLPVGGLRLFHGDGGVRRLVHVELATVGLDAHMIYAFTASDSPLPHFTLDAVHAGPGFAFHLDLVPRVDLAVNLDYLDAIYEPLTPTFNAAREMEGLSPALLAPRQRAQMSPWMLAHRADEGAFRGVGAPVVVYLEHWSRLLADGLPDSLTSRLHGGEREALIERDRRLRATIFDPDVDPLWDMVTRLMGAEVSEAMRAVLRDPEAV